MFTHLMTHKLISIYEQICTQIASMRTPTHPYSLSAFLSFICLSLSADEINQNINANDHIIEQMSSSSNTFICIVPAHPHTNTHTHAKWQSHVHFNPFQPLPSFINALYSTGAKVIETNRSPFQKLESSTLHACRQFKLSPNSLKLIWDYLHAAGKHSKHDQVGQILGSIFCRHSN